MSLRINPVSPCEYPRANPMLLAAAALMLGPQATWAASPCTITNNVAVSECDSNSVVVVPGAGASSLSVGGLSTVGIFLGPPVNSGPFSVTLNVTGQTTISSAQGQTWVNGGAGISMVSVASGASVLNSTLNLGNDVTVDSRAEYGGALFVRDAGGGNLVINNAGTVNLVAVDNTNTQISNAAALAAAAGGGAPGDAVGAVTNLGSSTITNSGSVTAVNGRGLYSEGNHDAVITDDYGNITSTLSPAVTVSADNTVTGSVDALLAGMRVINYYGLAQASNEGLVHSSAKQAIVSWSSAGDSLINNSGTATSDYYNAIVSATERGNATIVNSGTATGGTPGNSAAGYAGLRAEADYAGDITITNTSTGIVSASSDAAIVANTPQGHATVTNNGLVTGLSGVFIDNGSGLGINSVNSTSATSGTTIIGTAELVNTGMITAKNYGAYIDGSTNILNNTGTISVSSSGTAAYLGASTSGSVSNSGRMFGGDVGIQVNGDLNTIVNSGSLQASRYGILNQDGVVGSIWNTSSGQIIGTADRSEGITNNGTVTGSIVNDGVIQGLSATVNDYPGTPEANPVGINNLGSVGSIINNGTIISTGSANGMGIQNTGIDSSGNYASVGTLTNAGVIIVDSRANTRSGNQGYAVGIENTFGTIGVLTNSGAITSTGYAAVEQSPGANAYGIENYRSITTLVNSGVITTNIAEDNTDGAGYGVFNRRRGTVETFDNSGTINSHDYGVYNWGTIGQLTNSGIINGGEYGIYSLYQPGYDVGATIGTITNSGTISGGAYAISLATPSTVVNSGTISGGVGLSATGGTSIVNSGTISGGLTGVGSARYDAIDLTGGGNTLTLLPGYNVVGNVVSTSGSANGGDALVLDGSGSASFAASQFVTVQPASYTGTSQYYGFTSFTKTGTGTWTLTGSTQATTPWTIVGGTLAVSQDGSLGAPNSTVTINGGMLQATASFSTSRTLAVGANGGTISTDANVTLTDTGILLGAGLLTKAGLGTLNLNGDMSAFTGLTTVAEGQLNIGGSLAGSSMTILSGGSLVGSGTIGNVVALAGSTVAPGNSPGTLTVVRNYDQKGGSVYEAQLVPGSSVSDKVSVGGIANLENGAILDVSKYGSGTYALDARYTILTAAGGVNGHYTLTGDTRISNFFAVSADYGDPNAIVLKATQTRLFTAVSGLSRNQMAAATGVQGLGVGNTLFNAIGLSNSDADAQGAFSQISGEVHASVKGALVEDSRFVRNAATDRVRAAFGGTGGAPVVAYDEKGNAVAASATTDRLAFWTQQGYGSWGQRDGDGNAATFKNNIGGFLVGADAPVFDSGWRLGALGGYSHSTFNADGGGSGSSDNYSAGVYGGSQWGALGLRLGAAYTSSDISTGRAVSFTGFNDSLSAGYHAGTAQAFGELGYRIDASHTSLGMVSFEPFAGLAYVNVHTDGFTEHGGAAALTSQSEDSGVAFSTLGLRSSTTFNLGGVGLTATGTVGWRHAYGDVTPTSTLSFAGSDAFTVAGVPIARNAALVEAGLSTALTQDVNLSVSYIGQFGRGTQNQGFRGNLSWRF